MTRKLLPFPGAESVLDPLTLESEMRIAALRAAHRAAAAAAHARPAQPTENRDPVADMLALYNGPPRRPSPLSAITVESYAASIRHAAQQLRQVPGIAAQARAADTLPALMSPAEARLLQLLGGSGRIDRYGIRHFDNPALMPDSAAPDLTAFGPPTLYPPLDPNDLTLNWSGTSGPASWGSTASLPAVQPADYPAAPTSQPVFHLTANTDGGGLLNRLLGIGTAQAQAVEPEERVGSELSETDELRLESYNEGLRQLQAIEPNNQQLRSFNPPNYVPNQSTVDTIWNEVAAARARAAGGGPSTAKNPFGIPGHFVPQPSNKGGGTTYVDPANPAYNRVRVMPGNPNSPNPAQRNPYVVDLRNGQAVDVDGNRLPRTEDPAAHIPQNRYIYRP